MKVLLIQDKPQKIYGVVQAVIQDEIINASDVKIPVYQLIKQAPKIYICYSLYNQCKNLVVQALIAMQARPSLELFVFIGDVRQCWNGFIKIESFQDIETFGDSSIEYSVQRGLDDIYYRTRQLLLVEPCLSLYKSCNKNMDKLVTLLDNALQDTRTYDIEIGTQLVPYLKSNVWHPDEDYISKYGIDPNQLVVHNEERFAYAYQTTLFDKLTAYATLFYYKAIAIAPLERIYTDGDTWICRPVADYDDTFKPTPLYRDTTTEHDDTEIIDREYVLPMSACGSLKKVNEFYYAEYTDGNNL